MIILSAIEENMEDIEAISRVQGVEIDIKKVMLDPEFEELKKISGIETDRRCEQKPKARLLQAGKQYRPVIQEEYSI